MKNLLLTLLCIVGINYTTTAQQRIGIDVSSRLTDIHLTANYQRVVKTNFLLNGGLTVGSMGRKFIFFDNDTTLLKNGYVIQSPYSAVPTTITDTASSNFQLFRYDMNATGFGALLGIGFFKEFSVNHGIRFYLNTKFHFVQSRVHCGYYNIQQSNYTYSVFHQNYFVGSISPELVHTIRLSGRTTFYYGVKVPYYFSLDKGKFRPTTTKELLSGFEADLCIGLTYVIGKCD